MKIFEKVYITAEREKNLRQKKPTVDNLLGKQKHT